MATCSLSQNSQFILEHPLCFNARNGKVTKRDWEHLQTSRKATNFIHWFNNMEDIDQPECKDQVIDCSTVVFP